MGLQFLPPVTESVQKYHYFKIAWENRSAGPLSRQTLKTEYCLGSQIPIVSAVHDFFNRKIKGQHNFIGTLCLQVLSWVHMVAPSHNLIPDNPPTTPGQAAKSNAL